MPNPSNVVEYKCPCCGAGLTFSQTEQKLSCDACGNAFDLDAVQAYAEVNEQEQRSDFTWEETSAAQLSEEEEASMQLFTCPSCGGELITDGNTAATFCPFCENPAILSSRLRGELRPDAVIPFRTTKEDAKRAFLNMCKGKLLLPRGFTDEQRLEKITGIYAPFWLYDCAGNFNGSYNATRVHHWSDSQYIYTKTDHFLLTRSAEAEYEAIPMDGSSKMDNAIMESIEPFDTSAMQPFDMAYLSGFLADRYDVASKLGESRIRQRVNQTMKDMLAPTFGGYSGVVPRSEGLSIQNGRTRYVLLPVWMLYSQYRGKTYVFAMNGQTGKLTGTLPICPKRSAALFAAVAAAVTAITTLIQWLVL